MGDELASLAVLEGSGDADLDAELVRPMSVALADAFDFRGMQGILYDDKLKASADRCWPLGLLWVSSQCCAGEIDTVGRARPQEGAPLQARSMNKQVPQPSCQITFN